MKRFHSALLKFRETALANQKRALPVVAAIERDEEASRLNVAER
jgi:hypothetical protein